MRPASRLLAIGLCSLLMAACASTQVTVIWTEPGSSPSPFHQVLVMGVANSPTVQRAYEDNFTTALQRAGVAARASHDLGMDVRGGRPPDVARAIERSRADGVIVTHLAPEVAEGATPGARLSTIPDAARQVAPYYQRLSGEVAAPGYYAGLQRLRLETNLYAAKGGRLVWSGRSPPLDRNSEQTTISQVIDQMILQLRADGYLP